MCAVGELAEKSRSEFEDPFLHKLGWRSSPGRALVSGLIRGISISLPLRTRSCSVVPISQAYTLFTLFRFEAVYRQTT